MIDPGFAGALVEVGFDFFLTIDGLETALRISWLKAPEAANDSGVVLTAVGLEASSAIDDSEVALMLVCFKAF